MNDLDINFNYLSPEMKKEVNELCKELKREIKYPPIWGAKQK